MADAQLLERGITVRQGEHWRLTGDAVKRLMAHLRVPTVYALAEHLGFSKQTFWRLRVGTYDLRMSEVQRIADAAGLTPTDALTQLFEAADV